MLGGFMIVQLEAKKRNGTTTPRETRKDGYVPACLYGKDMDSLNIEIDTKNLRKCLDQHVQKVELVIDGKKYLAGIEEVQRGHLQNKLVHVSFHALKQNEKATLTVPVELVGKATGQTQGGVLNSPTNEITIKGYPADLPDKVTIEVGELELGGSIKVKDVASRFKFEFLEEDHDKALATCNYPKIQAAPTSTEETAGEEAATTSEETSATTDESASKDAA